MNKIKMFTIHRPAVIKRKSRGVLKFFQLIEPSRKELIKNKTQYTFLIVFNNKNSGIIKIRIAC